MSRIGSLFLCYNIGLKCKLPKILLTTKMIYHSKSMQKRHVDRNVKQKIDAECFYGIVWREFASKVNFTAGQLWNPWQMLAEPKRSVEPRLKITALRLGPIKNVALNFCSNLCQLLTDFQNSFTDTLCRQFALMQLLYTSSHHTVNAFLHYLSLIHI